MFGSCFHTKANKADNVCNSIWETFYYVVLRSSIAGLKSDSLQMSISCMLAWHRDIHVVCDSKMNSLRKIRRLVTTIFMRNLIFSIPSKGHRKFPARHILQKIGTRLRGYHAKTSMVED